MMKYAKLNNGQLELAPSRVQLDGKNILNPSPEHLTELGYKPLTYTPLPPYEDGYYFSPYFEETPDEIIQKWEKIQAPEPELTDGDYLLEKLGL